MQKQISAESLPFMGRWHAGQLEGVLLNSSERRASSPVSARSSNSLASTVHARGSRASSSLPLTPRALEDIDELRSSSEVQHNLLEGLFTLPLPTSTTHTHTTQKQALLMSNSLKSTVSKPT